MERDKRYRKVQHSIINRRIKTLDQIFDIIPGATIAKDIHLSPGQMETKLQDIEKFRLGDLFHLAKVVKVHNIEILALAAAQYQANPCLK